MSTENQRIPRESRRKSLKEQIRKLKLQIEAHEETAEKIENEVSATIDYEGEKITKSNEAARKKRLRAELVGHEAYETVAMALAHAKAEKSEAEDLISGIDYSQREREIEAQHALATQLRAFNDNIGQIAEVLDAAGTLVQFRKAR